MGTPSLDGSNAEVSGNEITGQQGIAIGISGGLPVLEGNVVTGNETGLSVAGGATPRLSGNLICDNQTDVAALGEIDLTGNTPCDEIAME